MTFLQKYGRRLLIFANVIFWLGWWAQDSFEMYQRAEHHARMELLKEQGRYREYMRGDHPELALIPVSPERIATFDLPYVLFYNGWLLGAFILLIYTNWFWLIPHYLAQKRYTTYLLAILGALLMLALVLNWHPNFHTGLVLASRETIIFKFPVFAEVMGAGFGVLCLTTPLYLSYQWFVQQNRLSALRNEQLSTELALLKNQINPHFFFNTLNNLYALTLENSAAAPEVILKLSNLMRYTLYEGKAETVQLDQEVECLKGYLELQELRIHKAFDLQLNLQIADGSIPIPPLLLLTLVENAFKHGVDTLTTDAYVHMTLRSQQHQLQLLLKNNYDPEERQSGSETGLYNTKRRLALLYPPDRYTLDIEDQPPVYQLTLSIDL